MPKTDNPADLLQEALAHHEANRLERASALYEDILQVHPDHADALHLLGVIAQQRGQRELSVKLMERAALIDPNAPTYAINLAEAYRMVGDFERALVAAERAVALAPYEPSAFNNLGMILRDQGKLEQALQNFERAIEINPFLAIPYGNAAQALVMLDRAYEAAAIVREGLRLMPGQATLSLAFQEVDRALAIVDATPEPPADSASAAHAS